MKLDLIMRKIRIKEISKIIDNLKIDKIDLFILPGDNLNILKNEFDRRLVNKNNSKIILLRPS